VKRLYIALLDTLLATSVWECGRDITSPSPVTTAVDFWIDPAVCTNLGTQRLGLELFVDSISRGKDTLSIGEHSRAIGVAPGRHVAAATEDVPGGYTWTATVRVELNDTVSVRVGC